MPTPGRIVDGQSIDSSTETIRTHRVGLCRAARLVSAFVWEGAGVLSRCRFVFGLSWVLVGRGQASGGGSVKEAGQICL